MLRLKNRLEWVFTLVLLAMLCSPCVAQDEPANPATENPFPGRFPAPSLDGGTEWLNCSGPISIKDLRGKVVILDFWTYCCINCMHVLPDLKYLEQKYPNNLVVIGVHSAKFDNEKESENIREAIKRYEIEHPVVNDSSMEIARKYFFSSWPTFVLIDPEGNFVGRQPGEGNRELFDNVISQMIAYHRKKGTLDESPIKFDLEKQNEEPQPLRYPGKLLADEKSNRLFISDSNHNRIVISSLSGELLDIIGTGEMGANDGAYDNASFDHPQGMDLVGETLYVADTENHLIREVDLKTKTVKTLAGTGVQARERFTVGGLREIPLNSPWDVLVKEGVLYIAMAGPHQLWKHDIGSGSIKLFAGSGREDIIDGPLDSAALAQPSDITTDGKDLFIVDSEGSAIRRVETKNDGLVTTVVGPHEFPRGQSLFEFGDIDGIGDDVRMQHPIGLTYHNGLLYVTDTYNDKIKTVDVKTRKASTWIGTGERGKSLDPVQLFEPSGVEVAGDFLFIADTNNHRILKTNLQTKQTEEFVVTGLMPPSPTQKTIEETYSGPSEALELTTVKSGSELKVTINFEFVGEYKLNKLAPIVYMMTSDTGEELIDPATFGKRKRADSDGTSATISLPLTSKTGTQTCTLNLSYQYCRDGVGGLCKFATKQWTIPLTVASEGTSTLTLTAKPE